MEYQTQAQASCDYLMGNLNISLMVPIEVPIQKYFSGLQNYNPVMLYSEPEKAGTWI